MEQDDADDQEEFLDSFPCPQKDQQNYKENITVGPQVFNLSGLTGVYVEKEKNLTLSTWTLKYPPALTKRDIWPKAPNLD